MLWKKTGWFWKIGFMAISVMLLVTVSGCRDTSSGDEQTAQKENEVQVSVQSNQDDADRIIEIFMDFYEVYGGENDTTDLERIRCIVNKLGASGYPAVDSKNQIDMAEAEDVVRFCETVDAKEENTAFRVLPLDETYRELNRKYLMPIGYERNNMFLVDWSEADFGNLNFYDLYDIFYSKINGRNSPYVMDDNLGIGAVYQIPKDEFERVIMTYFNIDSEKLQSKTIYDSENSTYEYKPRGFYEGEYPEHPYPEVVAFTENNDGTIMLTVHVVFPYDGISKVYAHEVVVRPQKTGGVQYVSNRIIPSEDNYEETWHKSRLTEEEWKEIYGG